MTDIVLATILGASALCVLYVLWSIHAVWGRRSVKSDVHVHFDRVVTPAPAPLAPRRSMEAGPRRLSFNEWFPLIVLILAVALFMFWGIGRAAATTQGHMRGPFDSAAQRAARAEFECEVRCCKTPTFRDPQYWCGAGSFVTPVHRHGRHHR